MANFEKQRADALHAALSKKQTQEQMRAVKDLFVISGNGDLYNEHMAQIADETRFRELKLARRKKKWKDVRQIGFVLLVCAVVVPLAIGLILSQLG
ncbi:MAG: hypothetical protein QMB25_04480 [Pseudomonadales bacterium]|jgi:hypothetical protein|tara:strand:- start:903 stop:1190 length:288 start_codon:yes stop_codon:yes gene_type:complete